MIEKIISEVIDKCCSLGVTANIPMEFPDFMIWGNLESGGLCIKFIDTRLKLTERKDYYYYTFDSVAQSDKRQFIEPVLYRNIYKNDPVVLFVPAKYKTIPKKLVATKTKSFFGVTIFSRNNIVTEYEERESKEVIDLELLNFEAKFEISYFIIKIKQRRHLNTIFINSK